MDIMKGAINYIDDCEAALLDSELGRKYFSQPGNAHRALEEGFTKDEIYIAIDNNKCVGFFWVIDKGAFHSFPYLHIIAVKEEYRNKGIGKMLMNYFEEISFKNSSKVFLVVAEFNPEAKRLYENLGYREIGPIPGLYRAGITEYLMMKERN